MTKQITIIQENTAPIMLEDNDGRSVDEYVTELSKLLESNNVSIIHTSSCSVITRPNKVTSIIVREFPSPEDDKSNQPRKEDPKSEQKEESPDGIISD